jgi:molybdopterin molybdotransferase
MELSWTGKGVATGTPSGPGARLARRWSERPSFSGRAAPARARSVRGGSPGNPVSAMVCSVLFLLPALDRLSGLPGDPPRTLRALAGAALPENDGRSDHLRASLAPGPDGVPVATPFPVQDSSMMKTLAQAEALILRAPGAPALPAGAAVQVISLRDLGI